MMSIKGKVLTWEQFQEQNQAQTIVQVTYSFQDREDFTRILISGFRDREEAWNWCKREDIRPKVEYTKDQKSIQTSVKLYGFKKVLRRLEQDHPKRTSAWLLTL